MDSFRQWFASTGGVLDTDYVDFKEFEGQGYGAVALKDIPEEHTLFTIPRSSVLSTRTSALPDLLGHDQWQNLKLHEGWTGLILCMLWEEARGSQSPWAAYLATLPTSFDTPMFWSDVDLAELEGTAVLEKIGKDQATEAYTNILVPTLKSRPDLFTLPEVNYTEAKFHIAGSRILSRSFTVEAPDTNMAESDSEDDSDDEKDDPANVAMVPVADILNARYHSNSKLFYEPSLLRMVSTEPIAAQSQIWNTYGEPPNSDLLRRYGYVDLIPMRNEAQEMGNPSDIVEIRADLVTLVLGGAEKFHERIEWWLDEGGDDVFVIEQSLEIPEELISLGRLLLQSEEAWSKRKMPKPKEEVDVLRLIREVVDRRKTLYPTTLEEDEALLNTELSLNKKHAVLVRLGEKRILREVVKYLDERLAIEEASASTSKRKADHTSNSSSSKKARR